MSQTETKGEQIKRLLDENPDMDVGEIKDEVGCSKSRVYQVKSNMDNQKEQYFSIGDKLMDGDGRNAEIVDILTSANSRTTKYEIGFVEEQPHKTERKTELVERSELVTNYIVTKGGDNEC